MMKTDIYTKKYSVIKKQLSLTPNCFSNRRLFNFLTQYYFPWPCQKGQSRQTKDSQRVDLEELDECAIVKYKQFNNNDTSSQ